MKPDYEELRALKLWFEKHYPQDMPYCPHAWSSILDRAADLSEAQLEQHSEKSVSVGKCSHSLVIGSSFGPDICVICGEPF